MFTTNVRTGFGAKLSEKTTSVSCIEFIHSETTRKCRKPIVVQMMRKTPRQQDTGSDSWEHCGKPDGTEKWKQFSWLCILAAPLRTCTVLYFSQCPRDVVVPCFYCIFHNVPLRCSGAVCISQAVEPTKQSQPISSQSNLNTSSKISLKKR